MASSSRSALQVADMDIRRAHNRAETTKETKETVENGSYGDRVMASVTNLIGMVNDARKAKRSKAVEKANDLAGTIRDAYWQLTTKMNRMLKETMDGMQNYAEEAETPTEHEEATEGLIAAAREARKAAGQLFDAAAKGAEKAISNAQKAYEAARDEFIRRYHEAAALVEGGAEVLTEEGFTAETAEEAQEQESTVQYSERSAGEAEETDAGAEETAEEEYAGTEAEEAAAEETAEAAEETATEAAQETVRKAVIERAYAMGQQYAEKAERARRRGTTGRTKGTGTISYMGNVGNNAGVTDTGERQNVSKIMKRLSSQQAASVEALEQVVRATGINMVLYESNAEAGAEIETPNGWYDGSNNTVYVDLNSGMSKGGETLVNYAVLKTAAHEMTHYIESNSAEEYARLRDQMRRMLSEQGQDYVQLVRRKMGGGRSLSRSAAEAEVIADACEMMLKNTESIKRLAQEDPGLVGRIIEFLKAFARRLKRAMEGLTATSREAAALTEVKDGVERYLGDLQKAWDDALVEASKNKPGEDATITKRETVSKAVQYSDRKTTDSVEFKKWFGNSVVRNNDGSPRVVYHGTNGGDFWEFDWDKTQRADAGWYGRGHYFATSKGEAEMYGKRVLEAYLRIEKPFVFENEMYEYKGTNARKLPSTNIKADQMLFMMNAAKKLPETFGKRTYSMYDTHTGKDIEAKWSELEGMLNNARNKNEFKLLEYADGTFRWQYDYGSWLAPTGKNAYDSKKEAEANFINDALQLMFTERYNGRNIMSPEATYLGGDTNAANAFTAELKKKGYDGVLQADNGDEIVVFESNQIKSATDNVGTFDENSPDIRYSDRKRSAPSMRQTLAMMEPTADMNQTEKYLLGKYKEYAQELSTLQQQMAEEDAILAGAAGDQDEMTKAANRLNILRRKARRVEKLLRTAEQNEGFGRLMDTSRRLVRQVMGESSLETAAKAAEQRANEAREALQQAQEALTALDEEAQGKLARDLFDVKKLKETAKGLKTSYNSRMSEKAIQNRLAMMYTDLYSEDAESGLRFTDALRALAEDLLRTSRTRNSERMDMLREGIGTIRLTDVQKQELKSRGITMKEFRAVVSPVVQITNAETASDLMAAITSSEYFGIGDANGVQALFAGYENEGDAIMRLYDMIREDRAEGINTEGMSEEEAIQATMVDILSNAELPHPGDGAAEATRRAILSMAQAGKEVQGKLNEVMARMKSSQNAAWEARIKAAQQQGNIKAVAEYYRKLEAHRRALEVAEETQRIREQLQDTADSEMAKWFKAKELQEKNAALRESIRRTVGWMDKRIRKETDSKRIPEDFKPVVEEMVKTFLSTNDVLRIFKASEAGYIANVYSMLAAHDGTNKRKMESMYEDYKEEMQGVFEELRGLLRDYADASETRKMTERVAAQNEALEGIQDMVNMIWKTAMGIDTTFIGGLETTYAETSAKLATELQKKKAYSRMKGPAGKAWETVKNEIRTGNLTPVYFFRMLGLDTMTTLNDDIHEAQEKHAFLHEAAKKRMQEMQKKYNYWAWKNDSPLTFVTQQGQETNPAKHKVTLTKGEALLIYAIWRRESQVLPLVTSTHLQDGGFVLKTGIREENGKEEYDGTPHKLSAADMRTITDYLTDEQKAFADAVAKYLAKDMGALGNETSMKLFGIRKFKEEYYIPMRVQRDSLAQSSSAGGKNADESSRIMHQSATKRRVNRAYKPLVIGDFLDVAAEHIDKMTLYNTFAIPIENMNRVLNAGYEDETGSAMTVRGQMRQKYGDETVNYLERYIADLNGGIAPDAVEKGLSARAFSTYKRSAVIASASVAIQQPTSIIRAMVEVNPKYFVPVLNHRDNVSMRDEYEQLRKYSGVALIKERGGFDMTSGHGTAQDLKGTLEDDYTFWRKAKLAVGLGAPKGERGAAAVRQWENAFGWLAKKADQVTWTYMWRAVKAETADKHPGMDTSSEEFLKLAGKRFGEVMSLTQVYDSTLVRSQNMRSKTMFAKMLTAFMAEPTLTANMLMDAAQSKDPKKIARASAAYIVGAIATAAAAALVKAGRDDDDEKPWAEKWLNSMGSQLGGWTGSLNPLTLIPGLSDLMNLLDGYDIERADMSMTQDAVEVLNKLIAGKYADNPAKGVEDAAGVIGNMLGIPVKNLWRDVKTVQNTVEGLVNPPREVNAMVLANDAMKNFNLHGINQHDTSIDKYYAKLYEAMKTGNKREQELLREYLEIQGKDEKAVKTGVRGVVKGKYLDGQITEAEAKNMLLRNGLAKDQQEAFELVDKWREQPAGGMSYSAYDSARAAIRAGNMAALATEISTLTRNGWDKEAVSRELRTTVREQYMDGKLSKNQVQTMYTKYFAPKNFDVKDNNDWYWLFEELDYGKAHGGNTDGYEKLGDFYKAVETGANMKAVLTEYMAHGYDKSALSSAITSKYKQEFIRLYKTNRAAAASLQARLLTAYQALGYDRQKKLKDIQEWLED